MTGVKIALTGKMRSGKDTVGQFLMSRYLFSRFAFGDGIRKVSHEHFPEIVAKGKPRWLYQGVGQHFRNYDPDVWVKWVFRQMYLNPNPFGNYVITDLRQPNEFDIIKDAGFVVVRVNSSDQVRLARMKANGDNFTLEDLNHETEQHIDDFDADFDIQNDTSVADLIYEVEVILGMLEGEGVTYYGKRKNRPIY